MQLTGGRSVVDEVGPHFGSQVFRKTVLLDDLLSLRDVVGQNLLNLVDLGQHPSDLVHNVPDIDDAYVRRDVPRIWTHIMVMS